MTRYEDPRALDILAAAYAECGQFREALAAARRAFEFALARGNRQLAEAIQKRLELYRQGTPFRP